MKNVRFGTEVNGDFRWGHEIFWTNLGGGTNFLGQISGGSRQQQQQQQQQQPIPVLSIYHPSDMDLW